MRRAELSRIIPRVPRRLRWVTLLQAIILLLCLLSISLAQDIYIYPSKKLADDSRLEYRRYTLDEARAYDRGTPLMRQRRGGSFDNYLPLDWGQERRLTEQENVYRASVETPQGSIQKKLIFLK